MRKTAGELLVCACLFAFSPVILSAVEPGQGKSGKTKGKAAKDSGDQNQSEPEFSVEFLIYFTSAEARRLAIESELVGVKPLPPGIRKNLARGKPLPPGIARQTLPLAFVERLPAHEGYAWRRAGTDLVLIAASDGLIVEIAADVFE
jgi:hypothetical protein